MRYSGKHMFGRGTVHATLTIQGCGLRIGEPSATSSVYVTVDAASFSSSNARRDKDVCSPGLLDVATYPYVTFASDTLQQVEDGWLVSGSVTAHGNTVPVGLRIDRVILEGTVSVFAAEQSTWTARPSVSPAPGAWWVATSTSNSTRS